MKKLATFLAFLSLLTPSLVSASTLIYPFQGGTGTSTAPVKGDLLVGNGFATGTNALYSIFHVGTNGQCLTASSSQSFGLAWYTCGTGSGGASASGTAGLVQFSDGASGLNANSLFNWDNADNRLALGTTATPSTTLHVIGTLTATGLSTLGAVSSTALTASGGINFTTFSTGLLHSNSAGLISSSAVALGSADVSGTLGVGNGGTNLTSATDDNVMLGNGTTWQSKAVSDCVDSGGNHLNYTASTNSFSCGTSGSVSLVAASTTQILVNQNGTIASYSPFTYASGTQIISFVNASSTNVTASGFFNGATLSISGASILSGGLTVSGTSTLAGTSMTFLSNSGASMLQGVSSTNVTSAGFFNGATLSISGASILSGALTVSGTSTLAGTTATFLNNSGATMLGSTLNVTGKSTLAAASTTALTASGDINGGAALIIVGTSTLAGETATFFNDSGNAMIGGTLNVTGKTTLANASTTALTASGDINGGAGLIIAGNGTIAGTLGVTGKTTLAQASSTSFSDSGNLWLTNTPCTSGDFLTAASTGLVSCATPAGSGTLTGNSTSTYVAFYTGTTALTGNSGLTFATSTLLLTVPSSTVTGVFTISSISGSTQCLHVDTNGKVTGTGSDCGSGGTSLVAASTTQVLWNNNTVIASDPNFTYTSSTATVYAKYLSTSLGTALLPGLIFTGDTNTGIWSPGADTLAISTGGTEALRITSGQLIGIGTGTATPSSTLHVLGTATVTATSTFQGQTTAMDFRTGPSNFDTDAGILSWQDLPVDTSVATGTIESYTASIGGNPILTLYGIADSAGVKAGSSTLVIATTTAPGVNDSIYASGHITTAGPPPTLSSCGTSPSISGNDSAGDVTTGTGAPTACTLTFAQVWSSAPACIIEDSSSTDSFGITSISTSAVTVSMASGLTSGHLYYLCIGHHN